MTTRRHQDLPGRLKLPDALSGDFTGLIIGTFGASLDFAEAQLFRQLSKSTVNRVVLADQRQLEEFLSTQPALRRLNRAYIASPVRSPHAHHPKYLLLAGPDSGRLLVGSGNLSISGYAGPGECFTAYEWAQESGEADTGAFGAVRELVEGVITLGWVDQITGSRVRDVFGAAPWIPHGGPPAGPVVHNLHRSLLDQLVERVGGAAVEEVVATAPFYDKSGYAVAQILQRLSPGRLRLLVQERLTRLDVPAMTKVLALHADAAIIEASPAHPYPNTLLHAKFILVRTTSADFLLQGSANLSRVALCEFGASANVEIANLLTGPTGAFGHLLEALDLKPRADGLRSFVPDDDWGDGSDDRAVPAGPTNVCWSPPSLSGQLPMSSQPAIEVRVAGALAAPSTRRWDTAGDACHFALDFDEPAAARIDAARSIELVDSSGTSWTVYPYHLHSLLRLSATSSRAELLQEVGDLDLRDKELEELLGELDRVLIVDGRSLWRIAHPDEPVQDVDSGSNAPTMRYDELDWTRIGELPEFKQYGTAAHRALLAPTELGIVLQSLTGRFRADVRSGAEGVSVIDDSDLDDLSVEPESEDADKLDEAGDGAAADGDGEATARRIAPRQRVRRLWRNFVRRFVRGLADDEFVRNVGSSVIVPSYVVFNHLCRRLRVVDLVDVDFLTDAQIQLWSFMWGDDTRAGYLATLAPDELEAACKILADHHDLAATLAAIDDAWWHIWSEDDDPIPLRGVWRRFLETGLWQAAPLVLRDAAAASMYCEGDEDRLYADLYDLAAHFEGAELQRELSRDLAISTSQLQTRRDAVMRGGAKYDCAFFKVTGAIVDADAAAQAFAIWKAFEPERTYFRLETDDSIAVVDLEAGDGFYFHRPTGTDIPLQIGEQSPSAWEAGLERLRHAA
jgi:hypothetical protein